MNPKAIALLIPLLFAPMASPADPGPLIIDDLNELLAWIDEQVGQQGFDTGPVDDVIGEVLCGGFVFHSNLLQPKLSGSDGSTTTVRSITGSHDREFVWNTTRELGDEMLGSISTSTSPTTTRNTGAPLGYFFIIINNNGSANCWRALQNGEA